MKFFLISCLTIALAATATFADWKLTQKRTVKDSPMGMITTIYTKGVRQRSETKMEVDAETAKAMEEFGSMMSGMMPAMPTTIKQCDLKQDLTLNEKSKGYFIDYYDWSSVPPEKLARRKNQKITIKGTMTVDVFIEDSGKRQKMFGLDAKWLKFTQTMEASPDACVEAPQTKIEMEGWFVNLTLDKDSCPIERPQGPTGGCIPKMIAKRIANPGMLLTGTTKMYQKNKLQMSTTVETLELSKATLDQALFEVPATPWKEVDSYDELMRSGSFDSTATTVSDSGDSTANKALKGRKTIAIDFFAGSTSKINEQTLRTHIADALDSAGMSGYPVQSQADLAGGNFPYVIVVEIKKLKESGSSKIGGLFGKVTGTEGAAKIGDSEAQITISAYGSDRKTVVASANSVKKISGSGTDAVRAAIDEALPAIISKLKN